MPSCDFPRILARQSPLSSLSDQKDCACVHRRGGCRGRLPQPRQAFFAPTAIPQAFPLDGSAVLNDTPPLYSRRIMGWFVHDKLNTEGPLNALYRAFLQVRASEIEGTIHHSDRGVQYCSYQYNTTLGMKRMNTSMTQDGSPYDNAIAERVNGILKREWLEQEVFVNIEQVRVRVEKVVALYNGQRPHFSIGLNTPDSIYRDLTGKFAFHMY